VNLFENPIFLTERRLVHRGGVMAPIFLMLLIGLSMVVSLCYNLAVGEVAHVGSPTDLGKGYYAWLLVLQALVLMVGGFSRISRTLVEERRSGMLDSNRLTPLTSGELARGYWLGSPLREFYMAVSLMPVGLAIIAITRLPLGLWIGTQTLLFTTALLFGLLGVLAGMAMPRAQGGVGILAVLFITLPTMLAAGRFSLTNYLVPVYAAVHLFGVEPTGFEAKLWGPDANLFSVKMHPLMYTLGLQALLGILIWRGVKRKFGRPERPALLRWEVLTLFGLLLFAQYGLIWEWRGETTKPYDFPRLATVHIGALIAGLMIIASQVLNLEETRVGALRRGTAAMGGVMWRSGACTAVGLAVIAVAGLGTQFVLSAKRDIWAYLLADVNILIVFVTFAILLELCRLQFRRRAMGFFALGLFVLYALPFLLSGMLDASPLADFSFVTPGYLAVSRPELEDLPFLTKVTAVQCAITVALVYFWTTRWRRMLTRTVAAASTTPHPDPLPLRSEGM